MAVFSKEELDFFNSQALRPVEAPAAPKRSAPGGLGGMLTSFLPAVTGGAGALLGTVAGPAGTVAGGTLGAGLGEYLRQKITGEADDGIDRGNIVQEGILGAVPGVFKGAKALKTAAKSGKGARGIISSMLKSEKAMGSTEAALQARKGLMQKTGEVLTKEGSGLKVGKAVGDINRVDDLAQTASKYTGTPTKQLRKMSDDMKVLSGQVDDILTKTPIKVDGTQVGTRLKNAMTDLTDERFVDLDLTNPSVQKIIDRYSAKFAQTGDAKGVNDIIKTLNKTASRAADKLANPNASALSAQETAALALKRAGDDVLGEIPEIAPLKQQMAQIFDINSQVASQADKGFSVPFMAGTKVKAPYQAIKGAQSYAGAGLQKAAGAADNVPGASITGQVARASVPQIATRAGFSAFTGQPFAGDRQASDELTMDETGQITDEDIIQGTPGMQEPSSSPFAPENVEANIQKIIADGGTMKDVSEYLSIVKTVGDLQASSAKGSKPLSSEASKTLSNAEAGLEAIADFQSLITSDPGAFGRTNIPGVGTLDNLTGGRVSGALGTTEIQAASDQIVDVLARLRTGAAISKQEEARFQRYIPRPGDSPDTVKQKLGYLERQFQRVAQRMGTAGTDLEAAALGV